MPACEWTRCAELAVGYRWWNRSGTFFKHWFCRRHQRWWDRGVRRGRRRHEVEAE